MSYVIFAGFQGNYYSILCDEVCFYKELGRVILLMAARVVTIIPSFWSDFFHWLLSLKVWLLSPSGWLLCF